jgi:hypothetical protein
MSSDFGTLLVALAEVSGGTAQSGVFTMFRSTPRQTRRRLGSRGRG